MPKPEFEPRQIVVAHDFIWAELERWAAQRNLKLCPMPPDPYDLQSYYFAPKESEPATRVERA